MADPGAYKGGGGGVGEHKFFRTSGPYIFSNIRVGGGGEPCLGPPLYKGNKL